MSDTTAQAVGTEPAAPSVALRAWYLSLGLLALTWAALAALLHPSAASMVAIWERSETFAHGYVILPIALWLVWRERHRLAAVEAGPDRRALLLVLPLLGLWLLARASGVLVVEQYAFVGLWLTSVWALLGPRLVWAAIFPLLYLLLMVPNGEFLMQPLMDFTADFTVAALRLIGLPVFREGTFFSLPSGDWSVVETCSGIRYVIASLTLGLLYAYLTYRTPWKRVAFALAALIVPIIANGFRATIIVLLAHYSDMKLALGVDHYIYGWVWFGIVMLGMFWIGLIWREDHPAEAPAAPPPPRAPRSPAVVAAVLVGLVALAPLWEGWLGQREVRADLTAPQPTGGWQVVDGGFADWLPHWVGMDALATRHYARGDDRVLLYAAYYGRQRQGAELINTQNFMIRQEHPVWQNVGERVRVVTINGHALQVRETRLRAIDGRQRILAWQWNRVQGENLLNPILIKLRVAMIQVLGGHGDGTALIVAAPYQEQPDAAEAALTAFLADMSPALEGMADRP
ncbi:MAG: exosortase A [Thiobacillaceae bacterium]|jgi:exosortase A|nr:exosortase A [Thiobacillaceae bacterium]